MEQNTANTNTTSPTTSPTNPESVPPLPPKSRARPRSNTVFSSPSSPVLYWQTSGPRSRTVTANAATLAKLQTTSGVPNGTTPSLPENDKAANAPILEDDKAVPNSPDSLDASTPTVTNPYPGKTPTQESLTEDAGLMLGKSSGLPSRK
ncbi:hypothetical protein PHLCEN_2v9365 [Hermanssonia centrifuga]|uniref:Uncharacterized protein n=1 Tax=Hermanssonia centrifuga TaxID=98765 RepID=A0A2R6NQX1_9APHY|nr:hypothetical protein PHLCEN_2v9365 [Hermanssonia centrifuga]